ncbi:MAG: RNA pseudouridine synthase [Gammaproteobacteria bacterium]|nr:RNA pseudouridine synthase [Gammaproteobacteria bacterium]
MKTELHLPITNTDIDATSLLAEKTGLSKQKIKQAMQKGAVWLTRDQHTQRLRRFSKALKAGDEVHLYYDETVLAEQPATPELISDEDDFSIWYKPYGMLSQGSKWGDHCTIHRWVEQHHTPQKPAFIVHRLDRAATGLMIIAHKKHTAAKLAELFQQHQIDKRYRVIVHGQFTAPAEGITFDTTMDGKSAISNASLIEYDEKTDRSLLEVQIETGRKHQIRRHLVEAGFPVVGDRLYGSGDDPEDLQLSAFSLIFAPPGRNEVKTYRLSSDKLPTL